MLILTMDDTEIRRRLEDDPRDTARATRLRYVEGDEPGYSRHRHGRGFTYRDPDGETVRDPALRRRFEALAIPPAWTEVWICTSSRGHIQATGRDDAGRKQYIYHPRWQQARNCAKYDRMIAFGRLLPRIRRRIDRDLRGEGLTRGKVLASVVRMLETTLIRIGNDEYARDNGSYGLTTIRKKHVEVDGDELLVEFEGKSGQEWRVEVEDRRVKQVILECLETPGWEVFKYFDETGAKRDVKSDDVNEYLREIAEAPVSAKDFRTWAGTVLAAIALDEVERTFPDAQQQTRLVRAVERVAEQLGNTPAICRESYIHPEILDSFPVGAFEHNALKRARDKLRRELSALKPEEALVLAFLEKRLAERIEQAA